MSTGPCPVCGLSIDLDDPVQVEEHVFENDAYAGRHGYCFAGLASWRNRSREVITVDCIPLELQKENRDGQVFAPCNAVAFFNELHDASKNRAGYVRLELKPFVTQWLHRILLDDEAFAVYLMIDGSLGHLGRFPALDRTADLFDLPKFWTEEFWESYQP